MRENLPLVVVVLLSAILTVLTGLPLGAFFVFTVERAAERHANVSELGEPTNVVTQDFECIRGWSCEGCTKLKNERAADERVFIFRRLLFAFYVTVGPDERVRSFAYCGS